MSISLPGRAAGSSGQSGNRKEEGGGGSNETEPRSQRRERQQKRKNDYRNGGGGEGGCGRLRNGLRRVRGTKMTKDPTGNWLIGLVAFDSLGLQQRRGIRHAMERGRSREA